MPGPDASVLLPVLDEVATIDACLASLLAQEGPDRLEVVVADGGSTDGTRERLRWWAAHEPRLRWVDNPLGVQAHGLNLAARAARAPVLVRADAHTTYAPDYVRRSVEGVGPRLAVGGPMRPVGTTAFGRAVAAAFRSPLAIGPGRFHHAAEPTLADTVYLGAFRREDLLASGGFRAFPSGVAEDADFYFRWRRAGGRVLVDPAIRSAYRPRETLGALWRQQRRYGQGKAELLYANGVLPSWRPLAPLGLVVGLLGGSIAAAAGRRRPLRVLLAAWSAALVAAVLGSDAPHGRTPLAAVAAGAMQLAYGIGLLVGLLRGPRPVRQLLAAQAGSGGIGIPDAEEMATHG